MKTQGPVRYTTNLIRTLRIEERKAEQLQRLTAILTTGSFAFLGLAILYGVLNFWSMNAVIQVETDNLNHLREEYKKYQATQETVDKGDVELLNQLQTGGIFWSKKLAALGRHLPEGHLLNSIKFEGSNLRVTGMTGPEAGQDDLLVLQRYLQDLEKDPTFNQDFPKLRLTSVLRGKDSQNGMSFEFLAEPPRKPGR